MTEAPARRKSVWAIWSLLLVPLGPTGACVIYLVCASPAFVGDVGRDGNEHVAIALVAFVAIAYAAATWALLSVVGLVVGVVSLVRGEPRRLLGLVTTAAHLLVVAGAVARLVVAAMNGGF
jgi:hypothetical protein